MKQFLIDEDMLQDYAACFLTRRIWEKRIEMNRDLLPDATLEHPIIEKFRHFVASPVDLKFYEEDGELKRLLIVTNEKNLTDDFKVDPERDVLYCVNDYGDGEYVIRYMKTDKVIYKHPYLTNG